MLSQSVIPSGKQVSFTNFPETISSRFGEVAVDLTRRIEFPRGLLGMPDKANFVVTDFPAPKMGQFKLLQSLDEVALSFITMPVALENPIISSADIMEAASDMGIEREDLAVLLVVSVHRSPNKVSLSVNARAPLFVDAKQKFAVQYVFQNDSYKVQHML